MNDRLQQYWNSAKESWGRLTRNQKIGIVVGFLLVVSALISYLMWISRPDYETVFNNLTAEDSAAITKRLSETGIPYELSPDGSSIAVPKVNSAQVKVDMVGEGLLTNGRIDNGIFTQGLPFGITERQFGVLERAALEGELQKLITQIAGIQAAQVMITLPQESVWLTEQDNAATASVILSLLPGADLDGSRIGSLYKLVSKSVPNLPEENITILDQDGNLLTAESEGSAVSQLDALYQQQEQIRRNIQMTIQRDLQKMLGVILGPDKVIVYVYPQIDFSQENRVENLVQPVVNDEGLAVSVENIQESYQGMDATNQGVAGTGDTQIPGYPGLTPSADNDGQYERIEERVNFEMNRITREVATSPYRIVDLTIGVGVEPPVADDPTSLSPETQAEIQRLLGNIVRATLPNGDQLAEQDIANRISVLPHVFDGKPSTPQAPLFAAPWTWAAAGAVLVLLVLGMMAMVRRRQHKSLRVAEGQQDALREQVNIPELSGVGADADNEESQLRKQLVDFARRKPEDFVQVLRTWLAEE